MGLSFDLAPEELEAFVHDADDQLAVLNEALVLLECGEGAADVLQAVFRAVHTLKGSAGLIRHERMARLSHAMETVLDCLRQGLLAPSPELVDALLAGVDMLAALKDEVVTLQDSGVDVEGAVSWLQQLQTSAQGGREEAVQAPIHPQRRAVGALDGERVVEVSVEVDPSSFAPAARMYQALMTLTEFGEVLHTEPTEEEIDAGAAESRLTASVATEADGERLRAALADIPEVRKVTVRVHSSDERPNNIGEPPSAVVASAPGAHLGTGQVALENRVRIGVEQLDHLMNLTGELVVGRTQLMQIESVLHQGQDGAVLEELSEVTLQMSRIIDQLADEVMRARMVPVAALFAKFPRLVRDLSRSLGKEATLIIRGEDTELDRKVIEAIGDPLIHLLRNAVDHGLEPPDARERAGKPRAGRLVLAAEQREGHILITVSDDGRGIDADALRKVAVAKSLMTPEAAQTLTDEEALDLIFRSGISTARQVTDLSGRGVGMDIVRTNIERLNGTIRVHSRVGEGTTFELTLPLTMAIVPSMLVTVGCGTFALPLATVADVRRFSHAQVQTVEGREVVPLRDDVLPVIHLADLFWDAEARPDGRPEHMVVVRWGRTQAGLVVDAVLGNQEVVIKSLGPLLSTVRGLAGGSVLGNGRIALILDVPELFRLVSASREAPGRR